MTVDAGAGGDNDANKNKIVENDEEEPRSKISSDVPPSDNVPSPSDNPPSPSAPKLCDLPDDFDVYCINDFDIVTVGKEARWPGQWEEVVEEEMTEEQLLYSLQVKGSAMSNEAWQQHWAEVGPALLVSGWLEQYPLIPFSRVEQVTGVTFPSRSVQSSELTDAVEKLSLNENSITSEGTESKREVNTDLDPPDLSELSISENTDDHNRPELVGSDAKVTDESQPQQEDFSNEQIAEMWSNFYNEYYWYGYNLFVGEVGGATQPSGENLIEDFVAAKRRYEPDDILVEPKEDPVDNKISLAPDSEAVGQNATIMNTNNSESAVEVTDTKDSSVDVNAPQNGLQPCSDPQEECTKETPESRTQTEELPSSENNLPDLQEHRGKEISKELPSQKDSQNDLPDSQERCGAEKSEELPSQENSKNGLPEHCEEEKSNSDQLTNGKDDQPPAADSNKKATPKVEPKGIWQLSKSAQYTSIVWALQEAGIIVSSEAPSEVINDQTTCSDQIHCNGTDNDKETDDCKGDTNTNGTSEVAGSTSSDVDPSSSSTVDCSRDQSKQSLKRKR